MAKTIKSEKKFVEIHQLYVIKTGSGSVASRCVECATGDASMVMPQRAAAVVNVPLWIIYRWVELGTVHYKKGPDGSLTVCLRSLLTPWDSVGGLTMN